MPVMIIGAKGQLGSALCSVFPDVEVIKADRDDSGCVIDICDGKAVLQCITELKPDVVFNTAAEHELRTCEAHPDRTFSVNASGAMWVAQACAAAGARLVHISTDYVFGGDSASLPAPYTEADPPLPLNVYAASKLAGEFLSAAHCPNHVIVRTAALYGLAPCRGKGGRNFVETMLGLAATGKEVKVVDDEVTTPTYTLALARQLRLLTERAEPGLYHTTCGGSCSWFEFAKAIFEEMNLQVNLVPAKSLDFQSSVRRPTYTVLDNKHARDAGLDIMPHWREALKEYTAARRSAANTAV
mgnify:CR=1 FL=1